MDPGKIYTTTIQFRIHEEVAAADVRDFIKEWLETGGGCRHPDDPLFRSLTRVRVGRITQKQGAKAL